ncbi:hypothetical protein ACFL46_00500 [Candidatus Neomarinimicrobiota bacterium]
MRMYFRPLLLLLFISTAHSQWTDFELDQASPEIFKKQIAPLLRGTALALAYPPSFDHSQEHRLKLGVAYIPSIFTKEQDFASDHLKALPFFKTAVVVTSNILVTGKFGSLRSKNDIVHSASYGFNLRISNKDENNWYLSTQFGRLSGPEDVGMRAMSFQLNKEFSFARVLFSAGAGVNAYKARIKISDIEGIPTIIKDQTNYLILGISYQWHSLKLGVASQFHQELVNVTTSLAWSIY